MLILEVPVYRWLARPSRGAGVINTHRVEALAREQVGGGLK